VIFSMFIDNAPSNVAEVPTIAHVDFLMLLGRAYLRHQSFASDGSAADPPS
jgi:hypothetical protein